MMQPDAREAKVARLTKGLCRRPFRPRQWNWAGSARRVLKQLATEDTSRRCLDARDVCEIERSPRRRETESSTSVCVGVPSAVGVEYEVSTVALSRRGAPIRSRLLYPREHQEPGC